MTRFLIALLALLGLAAQTPACARVSDTRPAVGMVAAERTGLPARTARVADLVRLAPNRDFQPAPAGPAIRFAVAPVVVATVLTGIDRARE